jgi:DNA-binding NarL/FixJ family response regulator
MIDELQVDEQLAKRVARIRTDIAKAVPHILPDPVPWVRQRQKAPPAEPPPDHRASVLDLRRRGWSNRGIAKRLGLPETFVNAIIGVRYEESA